MIFSKPIKTKNQVISVEGKVFYNDRRRRIDVKKPIKDLFSKNSNANIGYIMELCLSKEKALERINELSTREIIPVLMYFTEDLGGEEDGT